MTTHCVTRVTFGDSAPKGLPPAIEILPRDARELLRTASQHLPRSSRVTAINVAITRVRAMYPQLFKKGNLA